MLVAVAVVALAALLVYLRAVVALVFGSVLVAVTLRIGSNAVRRITGFGDTAALAVTVLGTLSLLAIGIVLLGDPIAEQFAALRSALPKAALQAASRWLHSNAAGLWLLQWWQGAINEVEWTRVLGIAGSAVGAFGGALLMIVTGLYLAASPGLYRRGLLRLLPARQRSRVGPCAGCGGQRPVALVAGASCRHGAGGHDDRRGSGRDRHAVGAAARASSPACWSSCRSSAR